MKNKTKAEIKAVDLNTVMLSGKITFIDISKTVGTCATIGVCTNYHLDTVDKDFTTYPTIKIFSNDKYDVKDIEKGDVITLKGHFTTNKYNNKYYTNVVADSYEILE